MGQPNLGGPVRPFENQVIGFNHPYSAMARNFLGWLTRPNAGLKLLISEIRSQPGHVALVMDIRCDIHCGGTDPMRQITRREFAQASAALAAAMASTQATRAITAQGSDKPAGEKLRVAVAGVNGRGMDHVKGFLDQPGVELVAVCDADEAVIGNAMKAIEKKQGKAPVFVKDFRKLVEMKDLDIVSIATPNHWHSLMAIWAMRHGKDVYVEKPVSHNVFEGRRAVEVARETNRICQTGTQVRSQPGIRQAIADIQGGKIGPVDLGIGLCYKPRGSIGQVSGEGVIPKTLDYDLWCGPAPMVPLRRKRLHYDWHWVWDTGNGDLGNQGIHQMDVGRWGLGEQKLAKGIFSVGGRVGYKDDGQTANTQVTVFDYGPKTLIFEVRGLPTPDYRGAKVGNIFIGPEGSLVIAGYNNATLFDPSGKKVKEYKGGADHYANFLKAVRSRKKEDLNADILEGHLSSALCHLGNISLRLGKSEDLQGGKLSGLDSSRGMKDCLERMQTHFDANKINLGEWQLQVGRRLKFNPETEKFINDSEADTHLTREYRKGFEVDAKS